MTFVDINIQYCILSSSDQWNINFWRACNLTAFKSCLTGPVDYPSASHHEGPEYPGSFPRGVLRWNRDSPVSVVSLHWWPRHDWSLWPRLRRASSQTVTRPSCWQCDNPIWFHTALLSRFHALCRSSFWLHNQHVRLLGESPVESLQSHNLTAFTPCLTGPVDYPFAARHEGPGFKPQEVLMWNRDSPVSDVSLQIVHIFHRYFFKPFIVSCKAMVKQTADFIEKYFFALGTLKCNIFLDNSLQ
jgi:hypothetical protein